MTVRARPARVTAALGVSVLLIAGVVGACSSGEEGGGPDKATFCAKVEEFNTGTQAFDLNVADAAEIERVAELLDEIAESAPEEIRADVEARFAYVDDVIAASQGDADAIGRLGGTDPAASDEAQARIDEYAQAECGITLEPPSSSVPPTTGGVVPPPTTPTTLVPDTSVDTTLPTEESVPTDTTVPTV